MIPLQLAFDNLVIIELPTDHSNWVSIYVIFALDFTDEFNCRDN